MGRSTPTLLLLKSFFAFVPEKIKKHSCILAFVPGASATHSGHRKGRYRPSRKTCHGEDSGLSRPPHVALSVFGVHHQHRSMHAPKPSRLTRKRRLLLQACTGHRPMSEQALATVRACGRARSAGQRARAGKLAAVGSCQRAGTRSAPVHATHGAGVQLHCIACGAGGAAPSGRVELARAAAKKPSAPAFVRAVACGSGQRRPSARCGVVGCRFPGPRARCTARGADPAGGRRGAGHATALEIPPPPGPDPSHRHTTHTQQHLSLPFLPATPKK